MKLVHPYLSREKRRVIQEELKLRYVESQDETAPPWILLLAASILFNSSNGHLERDGELVLTVSWAILNTMSKYHRVRRRKALTPNTS